MSLLKIFDNIIGGGSILINDNPLSDNSSFLDNVGPGGHMIDIILTLNKGDLISFQCKNESASKLNLLISNFIIKFLKRHCRLL